MVFLGARIVTLCFISSSDFCLCEAVVVSVVFIYLKKPKHQSNNPCKVYMRLAHFAVLVHGVNLQMLVLMQLSSTVRVWKHGAPQEVISPQLPSKFL